MGLGKRRRDDSKATAAPAAAAAPRKQAAATGGDELDALLDALKGKYEPERERDIVSRVVA